MNINDVFISYRRAEEDGSKLGTQIAEAIFNYLESKGLRVFWDKERMDNGPFPEQLRWQVVHAPNYIFIATEAAMKFRDVTPPDTDYVAEEMRLALKLYEENPKDRVILPIIPHDVGVPADSDSSYPEEIHQLFKHNALQPLNGSLPDAENLKDIHARITKVNRGNLWNAGSRWLEETTKPGSRFANLNIDQTIMPLAGAEPKESVLFPIRAHLEEKQDAPLMDMIRDTKGHLYLIGEGGIGKTTALFSIMKKVYGPDKDENDIDRYRFDGQVPLFVELSKTPDTYGRLYEGGRSTFIQREVYRQIRQDLKVKQVSSAAVQEINEVFNLDPDTAVKPIHNLFTQEAPAPEYLLLLDGLNEVSRTEIRYKVKEGDGTEKAGKMSVVSMVLQEIRQLMEECPNVRVILTSRSREQTTFGEKAVMLYLSGVKDATIESYLRGKRLPEKRIAAAKNNEKLREILRIPLFLTLYASLEGTGEVRTRGEILHLFFHQKREKLYTAKARNEKVIEDVRRAASDQHPQRLTADMQSFILDFILPEIAWRMERDGEFYIKLRDRGSREGLRSIVWRVLTDRSETAVCGEVGTEAFPNYSRESDTKSTLTTARDICRCMGDGEQEENAREKIVGGVMDCAVLTLGILQKNLTDSGQKEYGFIHHHIQVYFAAVRQISRLRMAALLEQDEDSETARKCLREWAERPLNAGVRRLIGEALGEAHNAPEYGPDGKWRYTAPDALCSRSLLKRVLNIYRGRFGREDGYAVWNILEILKDTRQDLSGEDLSLLDLEDCEINGCPLGRNGCSAGLRGAKISEEFLMPNGHTNFVNSVAFHPSGSRIITASNEGTVKIWDAGTQQVIGTITMKGSVSCAAYSPDGKRIVTAMGNEVRVWDGDTRHLISPVLWSRNAVTSVAFSPDPEGRYIIVASGPGPVRVFTSDGYKPVLRLNRQTGWINSCAYSPDGKRIVTASSDKTARVWDASTGKELQALTEHKKSVRSAAFSPDGKKIITASDDALAIIWDAETYQIMGTLSGHSKHVTSAFFSPDGQLIATVSGDNTIRLWDADTLREIGAFTKRVIDVSSAVVINSAAFSPDSHCLATSFGDRSVRVWDTRTLQETGTLNGYVNWISSASFSPDGKRIVFSADKTCKVWDVATKRLCGILSGHGDAVNFASYSPDGREIATASYDWTVKIWDAHTLRLTDTLRGHTGSVYYLTYDSGSKRLVTISSDRTIRVWDMEKKREIGRLGEDAAVVISVRFSPDDRFIVTFYRSGVAKMWDAKTCAEIGTLDGVTSQKDYTLAGPHGWKLLIEARELSVAVWDPASGNVVKHLSGHASWIITAVFSPDNQYILTASSDGTAILWNAETFDRVHTFYNIPGLEVQGVDLRLLHPDSALPDDVKERLYEYGAIVDERG